MASAPEARSKTMSVGSVSSMSYAAPPPFPQHEQLVLTPVPTPPLKQRGRWPLFLGLALVLSLLALLVWWLLG